MGHDARLFLMTRDNPVAWEARFTNIAVYPFAGPVGRMMALNRMILAIRSWRPSVLYLRWDLFYPQLLLLPRHVPLVVEINTDDLKEDAHESSARATYNRRTRSMLFRRAQGLVFVTNELSELRSFSGYKARHQVITNGIDLASYPHFEPPGNERPRLVFVGSAGQPWHGIDKIASLARQRPDWRFDVVGMLDEGIAAPDNVQWHGPLERAAVLDVLSHADVGMGTLALHRKGMNEATPLKVREYLAVGLPVICPYLDPDTTTIPEYALQISNTESNVADDLSAIDGFVERSKGIRVPRARIAHLDVTAKEQQRLDLFRELAHA
jgi:glycosyltransferase involved in cell wall biosynthesis